MADLDLSNLPLPPVLGIKRIVGYSLTEYPSYFTEEQVAAIRQAIEAGILRANYLIDEG